MYRGYSVSEYSSYEELLYRLYVRMLEEQIDCIASNVETYLRTVVSFIVCIVFFSTFEGT